MHIDVLNPGLHATKTSSTNNGANSESADFIPTTTSYNEDPSGLFRTTPDGSYVPAVLTVEEYAELRKHEADRHADKNYAAWGPRFHPADGPVADDMAWMVNPGLWTGEVPEPSSSQETSENDCEVEDTPLPLHLGAAFLEHAMPWSRATTAAFEKCSWQSTYERFCQGEPVQEIIGDAIQSKCYGEGDDVQITCRLVGQILDGVTHYGGVAAGDTDKKASVEHVDLGRIAHHCAPSSSDWYVMQQAEQDVVAVDSVAASDASARLNFLKAILRVRTGDDDPVMTLDQFSSGDLAEMYLCMDWYVALRRIGISDPFGSSKK